MSERSRGEDTEGDRKSRVGTVVSDKMDKTIVVSVEREFPHPLYGKRLSRQSKFFAHDEENRCRKGDVVQIEETRPISKKKRWRLVELIERPEAEQVEGVAVEEPEV